MRAASNGDLPSVRALLAAGADVNATNKSGQTALMVAAVMGHGEIVASLIEAGADPHLRDRLGLTALEWSSRRGFPEVSRLLTKLSPPSGRPLPAKATSPQPATESQPSTPPDLNTNVSQVTEAPPPPTSAVNSHEQILSEHQELASQVTPVEESRSPEGLAESAKSDPVSEMVSMTSSSTVGEEITSESKPITPEPAPIADTRLAEESTEPAKLDPVSEVVSITSPTTGAEEVPSESKPLTSEQASVEASWLLGESPEPAKSYPVSEMVSTTLPTTGEVDVPAESKLLAPEPPTMSESQSPEQPPKPFPVTMDTASASAPEVAVESESHFSTGSAPQSAQPQPPVSRLVPDVDSAADSRNLASLESPTSSTKSLTLESEEEETLSRPRAPASARRPRPVSPAASSSPIAKEPPLERMPWMVDREPGFQASPLGLSSAKASTESPAVSNLKRCPKCNTIYQSSMFYCTSDKSALIGIHEPHSVVAANSSTPVAVWLLIAFVLGASAFAAYRLTQYLYRADAPAPASVAATPVQPAAEANRPTFTVAGALAGMEVSVPEPEYPSGLQDAGVTGPITVSIRVNKDGRVISAASSSGDRRLRAAAVKAARQATFAADKLAAANPRSRVVSGTITYALVPPQPATTTSPAPTETDSSSATNAPNADPNAPVVSDSLANAAISVPAAEYPSRARRAGTDGTITVTIRVNRSGRVISWRSSPGDSQLRAAAIQAARKATFSSEKLPGSGDTVGTITYNFTP